MRICHLLILVMISSIAHATDYYVSSLGDDNLNTGTSPSSTWKTISKVNSLFPTLKPGDRILFKRGDVFYGTLKISASGQQGSPIVIGAYGTGENPVITGFTTTSDWTNESGGIFSKIISPESIPNVVSVDGENVPMGRFPDKTYLTIDSHDAAKSLTDSDLPAVPNWKGGEVVIVKNDWVIDRNAITDHSGTKITYTTGSAYEPKNGNGYFIQNHLNTLTTFKEWYYNPANMKFYMYFGTNNPASHNVKVSTLNEIVNVSSCNYITIDGISITGGNSATISIKNCDYLTIQNCSINFSGGTAISGKIWAGNSPYFKLSNCTITNSNDIAIFLNPEFTNATITGNTFTNSAVIPGAGGNGDNHYDGIVVTATSTTVSYNSVINSGYISLILEGSNSVAEYNFINGFTALSRDGSGIYCNEATTKTVRKNFVSGGTLGIYLDNGSGNEVIEDNVVYNCSVAGIYIHQGYNHTIRNNTVFNCERQLYLVDRNNIRNLQIKNNIFFSKLASQTTGDFVSFNNENFNLWGSFDYNYYARPLDDNLTIKTFSPSTGYKYRTLSQWQSYKGQDINSNKSPVVIKDTANIHFYYNQTKSDKVLNLSQPMIDVRGIKYNGSVTLSQFTSIILMPDPDPVTPVRPVLVSAFIRAASPSVIEIKFDHTLSDIVPSDSAFNVTVNFSIRTVKSVKIIGTRVYLELSEPVNMNDVVQFSYSIPEHNALQSTSGAKIESIINQKVTTGTSSINTPPFIAVNYSETNLSGFIGEIDATESYDIDPDSLSFQWIAPTGVPVSSVNNPVINFLNPLVNGPTKVNFTLNISDGKATVSKVVETNILPYKPELHEAEIAKIEASSYKEPYYPKNIIDRNPDTYWAAKDDGQWLFFCLKNLFRIDHILLAFNPLARDTSYFDILGSQDNLSWDPILTGSSSCGFSGNFQVFEFPSPMTDIEYSYIKLVGHGNSSDTWNFFSELRIIGTGGNENTVTDQSLMSVYPNPAQNYFRISLKESYEVPLIIKVLSISGVILVEKEIPAGTLELILYQNLSNGLYLLQLSYGKSIYYTTKLVIMN